MGDFLIRPRRQVVQTVQSAHLPAPLGGTNAVSAGSAMPPEDCIYAYNLIGGQRGLQSRTGSREWCTNLTGALDNGVRSILPFKGSAKNGASDKLFATTSTGIWDVTSSSAAPSQVYAFPVNSGDAGRGVCHAVVTSAGHFLLYCDEENGYHVYTETTDSWAAPTEGVGAGQVSGVNPANLAFVTVFKNRVWFVQKDSTKAWYLDVNAIYGAATSFDFGLRLLHGGHLAGLYNWSYDGGSGLDTLLVGVAGGGDVVIYQGTDPTSVNTFGLKGTWYVGDVPYGRRIATDFGGDLLILSALGILPLSKLIVGNQPLEERTGQYATAKIAPLFNALSTLYRTVPGWSVHIHPADNALLVTVPTAGASADTTQLAMSLTTRGWGQYRELPMYSAGVWAGELYFGTFDGRVMVSRGGVDGVTLADPNAYTSVKWSVLYSFQNLGNARQKQVQMLRPTVLSETPSPAVECTAKYGFNMLEPSAPSGNGGGGDGTWDASTWDASVWGDSISSQPLTGATGMGRDVAIAIRGNATTRTTLVGVDVFFTQGGLL